MSTLPFPYTQPTAGQNQIRQKASLFIGAAEFHPNNSNAVLSYDGSHGQTPLYTISTAGVSIVADASVLLRNFQSALVNYSLGVSVNAALSILDMQIIYNVSTASITSGLAKVTQNVWLTGQTGPTQTALIQSATPFALPVNANIEISTVNATNPAFIATNPSQFLIELFCSPGSGTLKVYGVVLDLLISR